MNVWVDSTGQTVFNVHDETPECHQFGCAIHAPSDHHMRDWPTYWRNDRGMVERTCPHGIGHPDPDVEYFKKRNGLDDAEGIHGCDGCCFDDPKPRE